MTAPGDGGAVLAWRIGLLREAGFSDLLADSLARDTRYDLHGLLELIDRGCPAELAARILAPIAAPVALDPGSAAPSDPRSTAPSDPRSTAPSDPGQRQC